ncbi:MULTISPECIES: CS1 type fimbrial major subunit [unclassified Paludibacterium]|uniref:CS1 type fimbrial major subunit n=1 Tax=unclassified Paludibacterium TaxID=2618429 RepID=UPI001C03B385|nr:CS1 type fimbrial major subunit [Paludibacterium sp. B53371]BEV70738.1 hypothetical protein THUN1379_02200 [Paludibacterium sp. THUN1379]
MRYMKISAVLGLLLAGAFAASAQAQEATFDVMAQSDISVYAYTHGTSTLNTQMPPLTYTLATNKFGISSQLLDVWTSDKSKGIKVELGAQPVLTGQNHGGAIPLQIKFGGQPLTVGNDVSFDATTMDWVANGTQGTTKVPLSLDVTSSATSPAADHYVGSFIVNFKMGA